jgi:hypothetical protein
VTRMHGDGEVQRRAGRAGRSLAGALVGFAVALLIGAFPLRQATALSCLSGAGVWMVAPDVELIDGLGDPVEEQVWWGERKVLLMEEAIVQIRDDDYVLSDYDLTRVP